MTFTYAYLSLWVYQADPLFVNSYEEQFWVVGVPCQRCPEPKVLSLGVTIGCEEGKDVLKQLGPTWQHLETYQKKCDFLLGVVQEGGGGGVKRETKIL